jgi:hypothetical protein
MARLLHVCRRCAAVAVVGLLAVGCADDTMATGAGSASSSGGTERCAWSVRADKATLNIAYPDTSATYWSMSYSLAPDEHLEVSGRFPAARYTSFVSYGAVGGAIDTLTDRDNAPDPPGTNPFVPTDAPRASTAANAARYTFTIERGVPRADDRNRLAAEPVTEVTPSTSSQPNTQGRIVLGSGGADAVDGTTLYRVYLPTDPSDPTGGAGLPDVRLVNDAGASTPIPTCPNPGPSQVAIDIVNSYERPVQPTPPMPIFIRPQQASVNLYPNLDSVYVATTIAYQPGRVVVIRGKAPTFPDTRHGGAITGDEQVRFWSMCTNELRKPYPVTACAADDETALDANGFYTYVISTPQDRPAATPATAESTWLDWGATDVPAVLLLRHMLSDPSFANAATRVEPGRLASDVMGDFTPRGAYCDKVTFEEGGFAACGL